MIVMEMLDDSWRTLYDFAQRSPRWTQDGVQQAIHERLKTIVKKLEEHGFVHGDFRANNIMVKEGKQGEEPSTLLIDFDWAGKAGEVYYPLNRNYQGIWWPSQAGSAIQSGHDRTILTSQWNSLLRYNSS